MKITVFRADKGDCLLLTARDGAKVLVDGGTPAAFKRHVRKSLEGNALDLVYVSHIDQDHIGGVLELFRWRAKSGAAPSVEALWHNAFSFTRAGATTLSTSASTLSASRVPEVRAASKRVERAATSVAEAVELTRRSADVSLNGPAGGDLLCVPARGAGAIARVGTLELQIIGPFRSDLERLRVEWNAWIAKHGRALKALDQRLRAGLSERSPSTRAKAFFELLTGGGKGGAALSVEGKRSAVTAPNLASLMLTVREDERRLLLTGDGHCDDIVRGLIRSGDLSRDRIHVDVLKIQHHGSPNNIHKTFCETVTADHYVFSGNGQHRNPRPEVVELVADSVAGRRRAHFWFNSNSKALGSNKPHMKQLETLAARLHRGNRRIDFTFIGASADALELEI